MVVRGLVRRVVRGVVRRVVRGVGVSFFNSPLGFISGYANTENVFYCLNNYTKDFTGKENRLAQRPCKGMFLILCMHFFIAYQARIT